ncbi:hypothetical protein RSOLAG22IIIB_06326 [Rhizoctonia solani]|uniref:Carbohydrate-binding module family 19 domain-containing protein n=1 Tax=Rhizoctonia solani TaxID=456999 RepID=A0A0K6GDH5_9AGAM|nr:hypothetical protein RSOLAG22IIIB_06326 [Rhizoctonia solani]
MKSKRFSQVGYGALVCAVAVSGLPHPMGHKVDRFRPRHSISVGDFTKTITVTVSLGPSTSITLGAASPTIPCTDEGIPTAASSLTSASPSLPSVIISTVVLTTEIATTIFPSVTSLVSASFSSESSESILPTVSTSLSSPPVPTPTDPSFNPITAPAIGGGNSVLAQNAADAQELNRYFRTLTFGDSCVNNDQACVGDGRAVCTLGKWRLEPCTHPNTRCRAVPRMQTNGTVLGCYTDADVQARISSTGQPGNAFGE